MSAGTVVITGGILATVILLCIIAVLCYCRLQYYCCKKNGGSDTSSTSQPPFPCSALSPLSPLSPCELTGACSSPSSVAASARRHGYCPSCSPYDSPFYLRPSAQLLNGGERVACMPTHYENPALAGPLPALPGPLPPLPGALPGALPALPGALPPLPGSLRALRRGGAPQPHFYTNRRAISTQV